jgi:hypothetical protein
METQPFPPWEYLWRSAGILFLSSAFAVLFFWNPEGSSIRISSDLLQNVVGIPCPFCGVTRGAHLVLQGEWSRAVYYNMLSFAVIGGGVSLCLLWLLEIIRGKELYAVQRMLLVLLGKWKFLLGGLAGYWILHLYLAWSYQKWELLNPEAVLFPHYFFR